MAARSISLYKPIGGIMTQETSKPIKQVSATGNFKTHASLTQALNKAVLEHFTNTHETEEGTAATMPPFVEEAIHMIFSNIAGAVNGKPLEKQHWMNAAAYCQIMITTILEAEKAEAMAKAILEEQKIKAEKQKLEVEQNNTPNSILDIEFEEVNDTPTKG